MVNTKQKIGVNFEYFPLLSVSTYVLCAVKNPLHKAGRLSVHTISRGLSTFETSSQIV